MVTILQYKLFISEDPPENNIPGTIWIEKSNSIAYLMIDDFVPIAMPIIPPVLIEQVQILTVIFSSTEPIGAVIGQIWIEDDLKAFILLDEFVLMAEV